MDRAIDAERRVLNAPYHPATVGVAEKRLVSLPVFILISGNEANKVSSDSTCVDVVKQMWCWAGGDAGDVAHGGAGEGRAIGSYGSGSSLVVPTS